MAPFQPGSSSRRPSVGPSAPASVEIENEFTSGVYARLAHIYDLIWGPPLQHGRVRALRRMQLRPGQKVLEVGVGTGINAVLYPRNCSVTGIDFSPSMLEKARERISRKDMTNIELLEMDASDLRFPDDTFDVVYAPYLVSVVPDPAGVLREMYRVCKPGGRVVILNHFLSNHKLLSRVEHAITPLTVHVGFKSDLDLTTLLNQAPLVPTSIEKVNYPRLWTLVTCVKR